MASGNAFCAACWRAGLAFLVGCSLITDDDIEFESRSLEEGAADGGGAAERDGSGAEDDDDSARADGSTRTDAQSAEARDVARVAADLAAQRQHQDQLLCACWPSDCVDGPVVDARACNQLSPRLRTFLNCELNAERTYTLCFEKRLDCADYDLVSTASCETTFKRDIAACGSLSEADDDSLDACVDF